MQTVAFAELSLADSSWVFLLSLFELRIQASLRC